VRHIKLHHSNTAWLQGTDKLICLVYTYLQGYESMQSHHEMHWRIFQMLQQAYPSIPKVRPSNASTSFLRYPCRSKNKLFLWPDAQNISALFDLEACPASLIWPSNSFGNTTVYDVKNIHWASFRRQRGQSDASKRLQRNSFCCCAQGSQCTRLRSETTWSQFDSPGHLSAKLRREAMTSSDIWQVRVLLHDAECV
jgi:hypothetical protein